MRGQASAEVLILVGAILAVVASLLYMGAGSNELSVVMAAARTGADDAIAALGAEHGCAIDIERVSFDAGMIKIRVAVRGGPPPDNRAISDNIRAGALRFIQHAIGGTFPENPQPVKTGRYTYDVSVEVRRVTK